MFSLLYIAVTVSIIVIIYLRQRWAFAFLVRTSAIYRLLNRLRNCGLKKVTELRLRTVRIIDLSTMAGIRNFIQLFRNIAYFRIGYGISG
jgi:hypothetical protein